MSNLSETIAALIPRAEGNPFAMFQLARMMRQDGQHEASLRQCHRALALEPTNSQLTAMISRFQSENVPNWHFSIVQDGMRNAAYDGALRRAVRSNFRVLEIGTGTGLVAMMAARAGAACVLTCEMNPFVAHVAREIVTRNGLSNRVCVLSKHSDSLNVNSDLGGPVDLLVSEIVSDDLLAEGVLPSHEHAIRNFLKYSGCVIPARAAVRVALAECASDSTQPLGNVDGFDLSQFAKLRKPVRRIEPGDERLTLRGPATDLFVFDLSSRTRHLPKRTTIGCRADGGRVNGVAQWIALDMDEQCRYENGPRPGASSSWAVLFHPLIRPIDTSPGQDVRVFGFHDRHRVFIWSDEV